jgi:hypothetical protein
MAHPPLRESDLTFQDFLDAVLHRISAPNAPKTGIKLDLKDPPALLPILKYMKLKFGSEKPPLPVWVNADLWQGPGGFVSPFNPTQFIELCEEFSPTRSYHTK